MSQLIKGGNVTVAPASAERPVVLGLTWAGAPEDAELCALVCGSARKVLSDEHFLFWGNATVPDRTVVRLVGSGSTSNDRAQVVVATRDLDPSVDRIVVVLALAPETEMNLSSLSSLRIRAVDAQTGTELASYQMGNELGVEACLVVAEYYRHQDNWKFRAVGQGYATGLHGLAVDYGVTID